jgi:Glycosyltransferase family 87
MSPRSSSWGMALLAVVVIAFLGGLGTANARFTQTAQDANQFLPRWEAARAWLREGVSPYSPDVSLAVQTRLYGRAAVPEQGEELGLIVDPLPLILLYAPWGLIDYPAARAGWMTLLEVLLVVAAALALRLGDWRPPPMLFAVLVAFGVGWPPGIRSIVDGHTAVLALAASLAALRCLERGWEAAAGILLALAMADPIAGLLVLLAGLAWAASNRRWAVVASALITMGILVAISLALRPAWPMEWLRQLALAIQMQREFGFPSALLSQGFSSPAGFLAAGIALTAALALWTCLGRRLRWLLWTTASLLVLGSWLTRLIAGTSSSVYLLLAVMLVLAGIAQRSPRFGNWIVAALVLLTGAGAWILSLSSGAEGDGGILGASVAPALACLGLLWVRWWVTRGAEVRGLSFEGTDETR